MKYRKEIDGLRALAILPVIFYHAGFSFFSGGYVGVDVFFVISGYLIASTIILEIDECRFSLLEFYKRRLRRIVPTLLSVIFLCIPFAWVLLAPGDMRDFCQSVFSIVLFSSNILFSKEGDYFDVKSEYKPLHHTWSLSVEEQYYILFPVILFLINKINKAYFKITIYFLFALSLFFSVKSLSTGEFNGFYSLSTRAYELLLGVMAALNKENLKLLFKEFVFLRRLFEVLGLVCIACSVFIFDKESSFPGVNALVPTVGAFLIIVFSDEDSFLGKMLSKNFFVFIGLGSYSLYLWHQPIFSFFRFYKLAKVEFLDYFFLILAVMMVGFLSWKYIEQPFRSKKIKFKSLLIVCLFMSLSLLVFGFFGHYTKGYQHLRFSQDKIKIASYVDYNYSDLYKEGKCFLKQSQKYEELSRDCFLERSKDVIWVWGDSHAAALSVGIRQFNQNTIQTTRSACLPVLNSSNFLGESCSDFNDKIFADLIKIKPKILFMHGNWYVKDPIESATKLNEVVKRINQACPETRIVVLGIVPQWIKGLPENIIRKKELNAYMDSPLMEDLLKYEEKFYYVLVKKEVTYLSPLKILCEQKKCFVLSMFEGEVQPVAWDYGHLTESGSIFLAEKIFELLNVKDPN